MTTTGAIETLYNGRLFRSRQEARWAVFFDELRIKWDYEPDAFALPAGNYLPDFRLHLANGPVWFEVKPPPAPYAADLRWGQLAELTNTRVFVAFGWPEFRVVHGEHGMRERVIEHGEHLHVHFDSAGMDLGYAFCRCFCGAIGIEFEARSARVCESRCHPFDDRAHDLQNPQVIAAYERALSARFDPRSRDL